MELSFSEIDENGDNINVNDESITNRTYNYWEQPNMVKEAGHKNKRVTFDNILTNMNLVVNSSGVLQSMTSLNSQQHDDQYQTQQDYINQTTNSDIKVKKREPLDPSVKKSFIYNKYFKDYQDAVPVAPKILVPKTKEEYYQMLRDERTRRVQEQYRISQIKSQP